MKVKLEKGVINNYTPDGCQPYPDKLFNNPRIGPSLHHVNNCLVKQVTKDPKTCTPISGVSYSLKLNLAKGGLPVDLVISHSFDEGVFEWGRRVLAGWPDECEGAFISMLCVPQNFDVCPLIPTCEPAAHRAPEAHLSSCRLATL